ncbi:MAG: BolA family transcriptional regulator [Pseudomonadota bacterium]|nr:BolA family transcriptional regulator [Pseudomonadota bacterium]MDE3037974.1 BolA family transcriptional regulator [Pseudomonadota bacterium]
MNRAGRITSILTRELKPARLELQDNSEKHAGHGGARPEGETHYALLIESAQFAGKNRVQRHRIIHALLEGEFKTGLHALAIQALATGE